MLLDPFTIIAQIVNFTILMVALKHFLYHRVIDAMDEREASIAARLHDADHREAAAAAEADEYRDSRQALEDQRQEFLDHARSQADRHQRQLLAEARVEVESERRRWEHALELEKHELQHELQRRTAYEVVELARRALSDLAGTDLEAVVLQLALDHLEVEKESSAELFAEAAISADFTVRTAFPIPHDQRTRLLDRLHSLGLGPDRRVIFTHDSDLILGVEFQSAGTAVSWHVDDYVDRLAATVHRLIDGPDQHSGTH